jgi:hypothetical protein
MQVVGEILVAEILQITLPRVFNYLQLFLIKIKMNIAENI